MVLSNELILKEAKKRYDEIAKENQEDKEQQQLFKQYPHIIILSLIMQSGVSFEKCIQAVMEIADEIGYDFDSFYNKLQSDKNYYKNKLKFASRYHNDEYFIKALERIHNKYNGDVSQIWNNKNGKLQAAAVISQFMDFLGVKTKKATMITNILHRDYAVEMENLSAIDISPDIHVKRLMYRMGLINIDKDIKSYANIPDYKVIYAAKMINPKFPGVLDYLLWELGVNKICMNSTCSSKKDCIFYKYCPKCKIDKIVINN